MTNSDKKDRLNKMNRIDAKIRKVLIEIEKEEDVRISFGNTKYDMTMYSKPMTVTETAKNTLVQENNLDKNKSLSLRYGFVGNIIGMPYKGGTITEFKTRNRSYPIIYTKENGKSYKTSTSNVRLILTKDAILAHQAKLERNLKIDKVIEN